MRFRPCIDIHNGKVKQIVGGTLQDAGNQARENFASDKEAGFYAGLYRQDDLRGGHVILLNAPDSAYFKETKKQGLAALKAFPGGLQIGGGIHAGNAKEYIDAGASHVIVTSYVFGGGEILWENMEKLADTVGKDHVVMDLSCRKKADGSYYVVTDRWQTFTRQKLEAGLMEKMSDYCDEFLIHGVDVEGRTAGIDSELISRIVQYRGKPVTYAGGIADFSDLEALYGLSGGELDFTVGSALDLFGGAMRYEDIKEWLYLKTE